MGRRGQVTVFFLLGAIAVSLIVIFSIFSNAQKRDDIKAEHLRLTTYSSHREAINNYIEDCIKVNARNAVNTFGITSENEEEFIGRMKAEITKCFDVEAREFFEDEDFEISINPTDVVVQFTPTAILVDVNLPIIIEGYGTREQLETFKYDLQFTRKLSLSFDPATGNIMEEFRVVSENGKAMLMLEQGNNVKDREGNQVEKIGITMHQNENPKLLGNLMYSIGPEGMTFERPAILEMYYSDEEIPPLVKEHELQIACKDKGLWKVIPSEIEETENTIKGQMFGSATCAIHAGCHALQMQQVMFADTGELRTVSSAQEIETKGFPLFIEPDECINPDLLKIANIYVKDYARLMLNNTYDMYALTENSYMTSNRHMIGKGPCFAPVETISFETSDGLAAQIGPTSGASDIDKIRDFYQQSMLGYSNRRSEMTVNQRFFEALGGGYNHLYFEDITKVSPAPGEPFGRMILKMGKTTSDTFLGCGDTPLIDNFRQMIAGRPGMGKCYLNAEEGIATSLLSVYPGLLCTEDYSEPMCEEIIECPVFPGMYPYNFEDAIGMSRSQRGCTYQYTDSSRGKSYTLRDFESGRAYCLPNLCSNSACIGWCNPDAEESPDGYSTGEGKISNTGILCGDDGGMAIPEWSELACEYSGDHFHYRSTICKQSSSCPTSHCQERCDVVGTAASWKSLGISCAPADDGKEIGYCMTGEGAKYRPYSVACRAKFENGYPFDYEFECREDGGWEAIALTVLGDSCVFLPSFSCDAGYCDTTCNGEAKCMEFCQRRTSREC